MTPQTSDTIGASICGIIALALLVWGWHMRRKERARTDELARMPLWPDRIAHDYAATTEAEWARLSTLALTDWPPMPADARDLPRTW